MKLLKYHIILLIMTCLVKSELYSQAPSYGPGHCANDPLYWDESKYYVPGCRDNQKFSGGDWNCVCAADHAYTDGPYTVTNNSTVLPYWQLVYFDDFEVLDRGFWYRLPFSNDNAMGGASKISASRASNNYINNGVLEQKIVYDPGASDTLRWAGENAAGTTMVYADYWSPGIMSKLLVPLNSRVQGRIKVSGLESHTWPAFWLFGANDLELDIFEITNSGESYDDASPGNWLKATAHHKLYGVGSNHETGVAYEYPVPLNLDFHTYELIWDDYKVQYWLDSDPIFTSNRYYRTYKGKNARWYKRHWRKYPVFSPSGIVNPDPNDYYRYFEDAYFPGNSNYSLNVLLTSGVIAKDSIVDPALGTALNNASPQQTDWFAYWLRSDCMEGTNTVNSLDFFNGANSYNSQTAYETGYSIVVPSTATLTLNPGGPARHAIFAATQEITIEGEFNADSTSYFLAHITACESAWDNHRVLDLDSLRILDSLEEVADTVDIEEDEDSLFTQRVLQTSFEEFNPITSFVDIAIKYNSATITSQNELIRGVEVLDLAGKTLYAEDNINANRYDLSDRFNFITGLYLLRVYGTQSIHVQKIWLTHD